MLQCSFCSRNQDEVQRIVTSNTANICNECVALCVDVIKEESLPLPEPKVVTLTDYERANLLWLFSLIGYPAMPFGDIQPLYPFTLANTGDWIGQLFWKLGLDKPNPIKPNGSALIEKLRDG